MSDATGRRELAQAAQRAAARQPDEIRLSTAPEQAWSNTAAVEAYAGRFQTLGFVDAGTYTVDVLPIAIRFLLNARDRVYAAIYEHVKAGVWANLVMLHEDGGSITFTTALDRGLEQRPGHPIVHSPGVTAERLFAIAANHPAAQAERKVLSPASIVTEFETAWRDGARWRKQCGFSVTEVASVILSRQRRPRRMLRPERIRFIGGQDGDPERALKTSLAKLFGEHPSVESAYLARVQYDEASTEAVALCLVSAASQDESLVEGIRKTFAARFRAGNQLDILFVGASQATRLDQVCRPFYERPRPS